MRTTLTIDDRVLAAARSRAHARGTSVGHALSELALIGVESERSKLTETTGFPMLPKVDGHVITIEMVDEAHADE